VTRGAPAVIAATAVSPDAGDALRGEAAQDLTVGQSASNPPADGAGEPVSRNAVAVAAVDLALGAAGVVLEAAAVAGRGARRAAGPVIGPVAEIVMRPPVLPPRWQPARVLAALGRRGAEREAALRSDLSRILDALVPVVAEEVLRRARVADLVARYVDVDRIVATVDLDVAAARLDADAVARRVDLDAIVDRLDLTEIVLQRVDLDVLVPAVLARIDLPALAEEVIDAIDLPEIIRESTGSMASETVQGVRMQSIAADDAVGRAVDRLLLRRNRRPSGPAGAAAVAVQPGSDGRAALPHGDPGRS
jgi:hypothetical protein